MVGWTIQLLALLLITYLGRVECVKCLSCGHTTQARDCEVIKECGSHEVCFASQVVSEAGFLYREMGCRDTRQCTSKIVGRKRAAPNDVIVCDECCDTPFCQASLCGDKTYEADRGTICYHCPDQLEAAECDRITECSRDEGCFESLHSSPSGQKNLQTGCMLHTTCNTLLRANLSSTAGRPGYHCFNCCAGDICNTKCASALAAPTKPPATTGAQPTGTVSHCVDQTDQATCTLAAPVVCGDPSKAQNAGCSHHCGFC